MLNRRKQHQANPIPARHLGDTNLNIGNNYVPNDDSDYEATPLIPFNQSSYGDSYDFDQTGQSYSRAIIDLSDNNSNNYKQQTDFIYYTIQPGDTLQNLSVKYSCPVASIKRLNNLWSDQEFYALSRIKLPTGKLRLIADVISEEQAKSSLSTELDFNSISHSTTTTTQPGPISQNNKLLGFENYHSDALNSHSEQAIPPQNIQTSYLNTEQPRGDALRKDSIFKDLDLNIEKARIAARSYDDHANALMQTLAEGGNKVDEDEDHFSDANKRAQREAEILLNDLSDYGLSYNFLILFIFIVCLVCPLAYVIYLEETHHEYNKAP